MVVFSQTLCRLQVRDEHPPAVCHHGPSEREGFALRTPASCHRSPGRFARCRRRPCRLFIPDRDALAHFESLRGVSPRRNPIQSVSILRRGRDSNPRCSHPHNSLAGSPIQPLSHLSKSVRVFLNRFDSPVWSNPLTIGGGGIRTHGRLPRTGFQDRLLKPLGHPSSTGLAR
jgi:hypothetical protein